MREGGSNRRVGRKPDQGNAGRGEATGGVDGAVDESRKETADRVGGHQDD